MKYLAFLFGSGAGGNRTLVQTRNPEAFYMLSFRLVVGKGSGGKRSKNPIRSLSTSSPGPDARKTNLCGLIPHVRKASERYNGALGGILVPTVTLTTGIKLILLGKIKQRVHSYYCHL